MAIRIEHEGPIISGVVASQTGLSVVAPAGRERRRMECTDGSAIRRAKTQMASALGNNGSALLGDRELNANRAGRMAIIRTLAFAKIDRPRQSKRPQCGIVKPA